ncbi:MAG: 30S ribosomal protein S27e [Candidatus Nanohaloarchaeota archaeon QJJ-5]|nr:30S ribosomal protein S27e [Candidatus Nanohaloarchaeota archaeon QJJ-5]
MARDGPTSQFIEVKCNECGNEQTVFDKPAETVKCLVCDDVLLKAAGGRATIEGELLGRVDG